MRSFLLALAFIFTSYGSLADETHGTLLREMKIFIASGDSARLHQVMSPQRADEKLVADSLQLLQSFQPTSPDLRENIESALLMIVGMIDHLSLPLEARRAAVIKQYAAELFKQYSSQRKLQNVVITIYDRLELWDASDWLILASHAKYPEHLERFFPAITRLLPRAEESDRSLLIRHLQRSVEPNIYQLHLLYEMKAFSPTIDFYRALILESAKIFARAVAATREDETVEFFPREVAQFLNDSFRNLREELKAQDANVLEAERWAIAETRANSDERRLIDMLSDAWAKPYAISTLSSAASEPNWGPNVVSVDFRNGRGCVQRLSGSNQLGR